MRSATVTVDYPRRLASAGRDLELAERAALAERVEFERLAAGLGACFAWPEKL
jgi:hypothetical protein